MLYSVCTCVGQHNVSIDTLGCLDYIEQANDSSIAAEVCNKTEKGKAILRMSDYHKKRCSHFLWFANQFALICDSLLQSKLHLQVWLLGHERLPESGLWDTNSFLLI